MKTELTKVIDELIEIKDGYIKTLEKTIEINNEYIKLLEIKLKEEKK
mgnify:FL=1|tara:strand:+ start:381 stop:521 length:141 start_codon:yes stop_codon:yes gene_type:complete